MAKRRTQHDSIIFDLDGTLWDSTAQCAEAWNMALRELRVPDRTITTKDIERIMGMPLEQCFAVSFPDSDESTRLKIAERCFAREIEVLRASGATLYAGVRKGLEELAALYPLFIVSNCHESYLETFFEVTELRDYFRDSECHGRTGKSKDLNISSVVERNELRQPSYIGDTASDQEAAKKAGVSFYHAAFGFGLPTRPCVQFSDFSKIVEHFVERI